MPEPTGPPAPTPLAPTGERTAPGLPDEEYWFARHLAAYRWCAAQLDPAATVLDAGAGEGYGTDLLPGRLRVALDYDLPTCDHLHRTYRDVTAVVANLAALPLATSSIDAVVCMQVIEHIWDPLGYLREVRRVLRPGGQLWLTTPNRLTFSPGLSRGEKPTNPFHVEEYDADQLHALLGAAGFGTIDVLGLHHGRRLRTWETTHGSIVTAQVEAVTSGHWPEDLRSIVQSVTTADFMFADDTEHSADLIAMAVAP